MAKLVIGKRTNWLTVFCFQLCVITNNVFGGDEQLYMISKLLTLVFFAVVALRILHKGKVQVNQILLIPVLFTVYCTATALWAYNASLVLSQMVTQVQLLILLLFTFWAMQDGVTVLDYLKAVYISGFCMIIFAMVRYGGITQYTDAMLDGGRMGGEITNENSFGMLFGNAALSSAYYFLVKKKRMHILSFALFLVFAFSSGSRKALLMIVAGMIAISVLHYGIRRIYLTLILVAVVLITTVYLLQLPIFGVVSQRFARMLKGEQTASDKVRQDMIQCGLELFRERPIHGFGLNNFRTLYFGRTYSHNNYIELLTGGGIIALVMYYLMLLLPTLSLLMNGKKRGKLPEMHLMLLVWVCMELVFGVALVQCYLKNSWLLIGVLMAESTRTVAHKPVLQEGKYETDRKNEEASA